MLTCVERQSELWSLTWQPFFACNSTTNMMFSHEQNLIYQRFAETWPANICPGQLAEWVTEGQFSTAIKEKPLGFTRASCRQCCSSNQTQPISMEWTTVNGWPIHPHGCPLPFPLIKDMFWLYLRLNSKEVREKAAVWIYANLFYCIHLSLQGNNIKVQYWHNNIEQVLESLLAHYFRKIKVWLQWMGIKENKMSSK